MQTIFVTLNSVIHSLDELQYFRNQEEIEAMIFGMTELFKAQVEQVNSYITEQAVGEKNVSGVQWGENILQLIAVGSVYAFAASGLSIMLAAFVKDEKTADSVGVIGAQILAVR